MAHYRTQRRRTGFTLIELMVVMAIIVVLATLAVAFMPQVTSSQKAARGADKLQGWLLIARQRALQEKRPTGIRLGQPDAFSHVSELYFIQQPEDFYGGMVELAVDTSATFSGVDFTGSQMNESSYPVQNGDFLELKGGGLVRCINSVGSNRLAWNSAIPFPIQNTSEYRVIRSPRLLRGEDPLILDEGVAIDLNPIDVNNRSKGNLCKALPAEKYGYEILFAPSGEVISGGLGPQDDRIILYVRDVSKGSDPFVGAPTLVVVHVRTGLIAAHPVDISGGGPNGIHNFAYEARSSGI